MFFQQRAAANATLSYFFGCAGKAKAVAVDVVAGDEDERRFNPMLSMSRDAFVEALVADIPPVPAEMDGIVRRNLGLAG